MSEPIARQRQQLLATPIMMGINRLVVTPNAATIKTPGVYIEEIPSG